MEQYATYADYVAAMNAQGNNPISQAQFNQSKSSFADPKQTSSDILSGTQKMPKVDAVKIDANAEGTTLDTSGKLLSDTDDVTANTADGGGLNVNVPKAPPNLGIISTDKIGDVGDAEAALSKGPSYLINNVEGKLSEGALSEAATEELDPKATVQYQLSDLMNSFEEGKPLPPWASPQVRKVTSIMNSRGMGASSMAGSAMIQAVMESGIAIATTDAQAYQRIQLQNLNNKQQSALRNAATVAAMDTANLNARLTSAVHNARNFLAIDTANLTNQQKSNSLSYQAMVQSAFRDSAAENATRQFNAKNQIQVEEFFAQLGSQVEAANANRDAAMRQFNVSESNAMLQFNKQIQDSREKFNSSAKFAIDQSNVTWRREVNTANTAVQNETNRINTQNQYNAEQSALNALWQDYRDNASFNFQKTENAINRKHAIGLMALEFSYNQKLLDEQEKTDLIELIGTFASLWGDNA